MWARNSPEVGFGERETPKARELFSPCCLLSLHALLNMHPRYKEQVVKTANI